MSRPRNKYERRLYAKKKTRERKRRRVRPDDYRRSTELVGLTTAGVHDGVARRGWFRTGLGRIPETADSELGVSDLAGPAHRSNAQWLVEREEGG